MGTDSANEETLLNALRGWSLVDSGYLNSGFVTKVAGVSGFTNSPASLSAPNATYMVTSASLPAGSQPIYQTGTDTAVFVAGPVAYLGYDWYAGPLADWELVLGDAIDAVFSYVPPVGPEISVIQADGIGLIDGVSTVNFGLAGTTSSSSRSFTIRNPGTTDLTGLAITFDGTNPGDFSVTANPTAPVVAAGSTTFTVQFAPTALGTRTANLHIASNDADENPFDIVLTGVGLDPLTAFADSFDPSYNPALWAPFGGRAVANTNGQAAGSGSTGNSLWFSGAGSRFATTQAIDTRTGGGVSFMIALANGVSPWETADAGEDVVLEYSIDGGTTFVLFGGPYTNRTWQTIVVGIPTAAQTATTQFRFRQLANSGDGYDNWAIDDVVIGAGIVTAPEIAVEQPAGTGLVDGSATVAFGSVATGFNASLVFTIRNSGSADLTGLGLTIDGANPGDFTVTASPTTPVIAGGSTTFTVRFAPTAVGTRTANLHLASNDADENPFDITLNGT
ncbi:MAG: choice-of-anchor D domain-containing protein, partial [Verrucomicrobia bacterium]|nr:choice-of-anchor D domain-containing protein [Verrucomicrobiota bacterium]